MEIKDVYKRLRGNIMHGSISQRESNQCLLLSLLLYLSSATAFFTIPQEDKKLIMSGSEDYLLYMLCFFLFFLSLLKLFINLLIRIILVDSAHPLTN